jgi:DUF1680 family protein
MIGNWIGRLMLVIVFVSFATACPAQQRNYPIHPVPAHHVHFADAFWSPRIEINRTATIPVSFQLCEDTGRVENFRVAAGTSDKPWVGDFGFNDSDVYKVMEGASYSLMTRPDPKLDAYLDDLIALIAAAQEDDGYLYTAWTARDRIAGKQICCMPGKERWIELRMSHELYNLGHMYEAAVAHWQATGKTNFLDVATKSADLLVREFGPGKLELPTGHEEVELGLVKLYRATGKQDYLDLARFFIDLRGVQSDDRPRLWGEYHQDHKPFREQTEAVGHAVRATYLYAAATDVAALTDDQKLVDAVDNLWNNVVGTKLYLTGGIGATGEGEAFGKNYELPNVTAYNETCAGIALCFWAHRMFLLHGDAKYIDVLERTLYNNVLAGVALDGREFFYPNPLASRGDYARSKWFPCACCPTNICRLIPSVPGYAYGTRDNELFVNLLVAGSADVDLAGGKVRVTQETDYPWSGSVKIKGNPAKAGQRFVLKIRIPGWARNQVVAGDLYSYLDKPPSENPQLALNGKAVDATPGADGYAVIPERAWQPGDTVTLELPIPVRRVVAKEQVAADRGRAAIMRGPLVYAVEGADVDGGKVLGLVLPDDAPLTTEFRQDLLGGVQIVTGTAQTLEPAVGSETPPAKSTAFTAIPYYAWAHRGKSEMIVWLARTAEALDRSGEGKRE